MRRAPPTSARKSISVPSAATPALSPPTLQSITAHTQERSRFRAASVRTRRVTSRTWPNTLGSTRERSVSHVRTVPFAPTGKTDSLLTSELTTEVDDDVLWFCTFESSGDISEVQHTTVTLFYSITKEAVEGQQGNRKRGGSKVFPLSILCHLLQQERQTSCSWDNQLCCKLIKLKQKEWWQWNDIVPLETVIQWWWQQ